MRILKSLGNMNPQKGFCVIGLVLRKCFGKKIVPNGKQTSLISQKTFIDLGMLILFSYVKGVDMFVPDRVILHCAATPDSNKMDRWGAKEIDEWHKSRGFKSPSGIHIGYHLVVRRTGVIEDGRPLHEKGAHCEDFNSVSFGVCYIGTKRPNVDQLNSLFQIFKKLKRDFGINCTEWFGHHEKDGETDCPGFSMDLFRNWLYYRNVFSELRLNTGVVK